MNSPRIDKRLKRKYATIRRLFTKLISDSPLSRTLTGFSDWAVVGGAVRDVLLTDDPGRIGVAWLWEDLDIAVVHSDREAGTAALESALAPFHARRNSFGGLKASLPGIGSVDLWVTGWAAPLLDRGRQEYWMRYLDSMDFGLNAVAFTWPGRELVVHPRWVEDAKTFRIELLSDQSPRKEIQPLRAIALGAALTRRLAHPVRLGDSVWLEIDWLLEAPEHLCSALDYLQDKLAVGRWRKDLLLAFLAGLIEHPSHTVGDKELLFLERLRSIVAVHRVG